MSKTIAITTSTFGQYDIQPLKVLEENKIHFKLNPLGRPLKPSEVAGFLDGCIGVIAGTEIYSRGTLQKLQGLKVISRCGSGTDNIDLKTCRQKGIRIFNTPQGIERAVAELVLGLMLSLLRQINVMDSRLHRGEWKKVMGELLLNKTVGLIGFGQVGQEVGRLAQALGAKVIYCDPKVNKRAGATKVEFKKLLKNADIVSLHVPLVPATKHLINEERLTLMKKNAILINTSRGGIVDESALYAALKNNRLAAAALDVFEQEPYFGNLTELSNVILTPHAGSYAKEARIGMEIQSVINLLQGLKAVKK